MPLHRLNKLQLALLAALGGGLALSLCQLLGSVQGTNALLAFAACSLLVSVFYCRPALASLQSPFILIPLALLVMGGVSVVAGQQTEIGSGLAFTAVLAGMLLAACAILRVPQSVVQAEAAVPTETPLVVDVVKETLQFAELQAQDVVEEAEISDEEFEDLEPSELDDESGQIVHAWTRSRKRSEERLDGSVTVDFITGQRHAYVHVPFTPAFVRRPQADCECDDSDTFAAEFDVLQPYGGRLSVRRRGDATSPAAVEISISIIAPLSSARAA
ncbi:hypothetical protein [Planctomicrobium piriforme]|uniref:Uncharacterized protein n=1 Tax=Planctomicrobium piriforme TaxID=1576369 RepID=A0A1I3E4Z8_9PLAN|nr:hypothetical protein [Planctomicrobium piriforme]SFH94092.1 hypothetical protein SAMN05421753_10484 [Planctomicrobium piriforme]